MRIRGQAVAIDLLAEVVHLRFGQAPEHERAGIDARRRVALHEHQVAEKAVAGGAPEVIEADVIKRRRGREARMWPPTFVSLLARSTMASGIQRT